MTTIPYQQVSVAPMLISQRSSKTIRFVFLLVAGALLALPANAELLKGVVNQADQLGPGGNGMTLDRRDIKKMGGDPFGGGNAPQSSAADQVFDPGSFQVPISAPPQGPPQRQPLSGNAQNQGQPDFQGQFGQGMPGQEQGPPQQMHNLNANTGGPPPQQFNPNDPDSSPELQIAWNEWHRRVAAAVYQAYSSLANTAFYRSPPMAAAAAYVVTRDGHIANSHLTQKCGNPIYNAIVLTSINSLNGNMAVLQFPQGSRRMTVDKSATFTQNYGPQQGFKYQMGDQETIRQQRR
jgi:hypothetical protein